MDESPLTDSDRTAAATPDQLQRSAELSAQTSAIPAIVGDRYELQELLAKGGMGSVHKAWDKVFKRTVAVKLIHDHVANEHSIKRFQHESLISAQLQHPNIPPVYDQGTYGDNRPFLAMKLVKGRTLDDHIKHPGPDTPNLIAVFEAVCQALGYAHSRGVIHRDLKPLNVMVGAFGEVQVMDWGLAKFRQEVEESSPETSIASTFYDPRTANDSRTSAGSVLGTPAYMPPEQAIGAVDQITERSDVFGLGAILCAILTGKPVFIGADAESTRQMAAKGRVGEAFARLDASGAEPELVGLAKRCLAVEPSDRMANGNTVAREVTRIRTAADDRAKQAELERGKAQVREAEQHKRFRVRIIALFVLLTASVLATGFAYWAGSEFTRANKNQDAADTLSKMRAEDRAERIATEKMIDENSSSHMYITYRSLLLYLDNMSTDKEWMRGHHDRYVLSRIGEFVRPYDDASRIPIDANRKSYAERYRYAAIFYKMIGEYGRSLQLLRTAGAYYDSKIAGNQLMARSETALECGRCYCDMHYSAEAVMSFREAIGFAIQRIDEVNSSDITENARKVILSRIRTHKNHCELELANTLLMEEQYAETLALISGIEADITASPLVTYAHNSLQYLISLKCIKASALVGLKRLSEADIEWNSVHRLSRGNGHHITKSFQARSLAENNPEQAASIAKTIANDHTADDDAMFYTASVFAKLYQITQIDDYLNRSLSLLRRVNRSGYFKRAVNYERLQRNEDFGAIRALQDFREFLIEIVLIREIAPAPREFVPR